MWLAGHFALYDLRANVLPDLLGRGRTGLQRLPDAPEASSGRGRSEAPSVAAHDSSVQSVIEARQNERPLRGLSAQEQEYEPDRARDQSQPEDRPRVGTERGEDPHNP